MKYVALLSGGKDSCFNLVHCKHNGHELIAAASLRPDQGKEELDSYLYQTVGQDAIELVAQALDVPLYRRVIAGSAVEQGSEYGTREGGGASGVKGDETEDLYELLSEVKNRHPDVQGVSVGAILSNYQRVRVEHVCSRLSLTPLCYLWQRDQSELLSEMISSGMEAILIKVAGIGLKPSHLGRTLADMQPTLTRLNDMYGAHICGEGGEYETLTLDCPLFTRRIVLKEVETVTHSDNGFATVAYLRIKDACLEEKAATSIEPVLVPPLLLPEYRKLEMHLQSKAREANRTVPQGTSSVETNPLGRVPVSSCKRGGWVVVSNVQHSGGAMESIGDEVISCFKVLQEHLAQHSLKLSDLTFVNIFISDMSTFPEVNQAYKTFFGTSPPARACVAVDLPTGINVRLDCIAYEDLSNERRALHVQGLSYWAPANIGPYSQAIIVGDRIFISGQIGMQPSNLALPSPPDFARETALAFQHVHRILTALKETHGANWNHSIQSLVLWLVNPEDVSKAQIDDMLDSTQPEWCDGTKKYALVPTLFVGAETLPKGALSEAQVIAHTGQYVVEEDGETEVRQCKTPMFSTGGITLESCDVHWEVSSFVDVSAFCAVITFKGIPPADAQQLKGHLEVGSLPSQTHSVRIFHKGPLHEDAFAYISNLFSETSRPAMTEIPVRFIATKKISDWDFALCLIGSSTPEAIIDTS